MVLLYKCIVSMQSGYDSCIYSWHQYSMCISQDSRCFWSNSKEESPDNSNQQEAIGFWSARSTRQRNGATETKTTLHQCRGKVQREDLIALAIDTSSYPAGLRGSGKPLLLQAFEVLDAWYSWAQRNIY